MALRTFLLFLLSALASVAFSQNATLTGTVLSEATGDPLPNVSVIIEKTNFTAITDQEGAFEISGIPYGSYTIIFSANLFEESRVEVELNSPSKALEAVRMTPAEGINTISAEDIIPTITLSEDDQTGVDDENISGLLTASRDAFINAAAYTFGTYRFRIRGYDSENTEVLINGAPMNDPENGRVYWSIWGGLNDVLRDRENMVGLGPSFYTFGGVGGVTNIDTRASNQWKQLRLSYSVSNRSYMHRLMGTYSTGLLKNGWSVSLSASRRWAQEGYIPGTFYDAWAYFMAVEKKFNAHSLNLTVFGAPIRRGKSIGVVQEGYDLAGTNFYNPNWGYQKEEKRNARVAQTHLPTFILTDEWNINDHSRFFSTASFQFGRNGSTALNWYNAPDPRPDYYRNLPSYVEDPELAAQARQNFLDNPDLLQIDWAELYNINYRSFFEVDNYNDTGRDTTINFARYMIEDRRYDRKKFNINLIYENAFTDVVSFQAGANYNFFRSYNYKRVDDLLGAENFVDLNQFAERDFPNDPDKIQNDLDNPNRILVEGDRFGYDYNYTVCKLEAWTQSKFSFNRIDLFAAANFSSNRFWRTGNVRSGLFPEDSKGDSEIQHFFNYGFKGGLTYKITGRNYLVANGSYMTRPPYARYAFVSPRIRNDVVPGLTSEKIYSFEGGYQLKAPRIKARAMFYFTQFQDGINTFSFYYDLENNFVNIALRNIDKRYLGGEFAIEGEILPGLTATGVAALGQYIYNSRQKATITIDNSAEVIADDLTIYSKNFFVSGTPQMAATIGLNYRAPQYWFASVNFNYFDRIWIDFNPVRRTAEALDLKEPGSDIYNQFIEQEDVGGQFTMDFFGGYSWKLDKTFPNMKKAYYIYLTVGVNNLLNNMDFITGGYEQTRLDREGLDPDKFPPKYYYAYGTNFFINLSFRM